MEYSSLSNYIVFSCKLHLLGSAVDLVKIDLVLMQIAPFHTGRCKISFYNDNFHIMKDLVATYGPFTHFIHLLDEIKKN